MSESCTALVAFDPVDNAPLSLFKAKHRNFLIGDKFNVSVEQDWSRHGVAGVVWRASLVLSNLLISKPEMVKNKYVLELGAGTAIPSITAAFSGAKCVIASDLASNLRVLESNIDVNKQLHKDAEWWSNLEAKPLHWERQENEYAYIKGKVDVILGADIVYIEDTFHNLLHTFLYFSNPDTVILLACKIRYDRDNDFIRMLQTKFICQIIVRDIEDHNVVVYSCQLEK